MRIRTSLTFIAIGIFIASSFVEVTDAKVKKNHARATAGRIFL
jgi:hypothetical protein